MTIQIMKKYIIVGIKVLLSFGLMTWLFYRMDLEAVSKTIFSIPTYKIILLIALSFSALAINSIKWKGLAGSHAANSSLFSYIRMYFIGAFLNNFLPTTVGGDLGRSGFMAKKEAIPYSQALSITFVERLSGFFVLILAAFIGGIYFYSLTRQPTIIIWTTLCFVAIVAMALVLFTDLSQFIIGWLPGFIKRFVEHITMFRNNVKVLLWAVALSILFYIVDLTVNWLIFLFLGVEVPFYYVMALVPMVYLVSLLPITINGLGVRENAYVFFFGLVGLKPEVTFSMALVILFLVLSLGVTGGIFLLAHFIRPVLTRQKAVAQNTSQQI